MKRGEIYASSLSLSSSRSFQTKRGAFAGENYTHLACVFSFVLTFDTVGKLKSWSRLKNKMIVWGGCAVRRGCTESRVSTRARYAEPPSNLLLLSASV